MQGPHADGAKKRGSTQEYPSNGGKDYIRTIVREGRCVFMKDLSNPTGKKASCNEQNSDDPEIGEGKQAKDRQPYRPGFPGNDNNILVFLFFFHQSIHIFEVNAIQEDKEPTDKDGPPGDTGQAEKDHGKQDQDNLGDGIEMKSCLFQMPHRVSAEEGTSIKEGRYEKKGRTRCYDNIEAGEISEQGWVGIDHSHKGIIKQTEEKVGNQAQSAANEGKHT